MKQFIIFFLPIVFLNCVQSNDGSIPSSTDPEVVAIDTLTYLALGDSYTIGQSVETEERFPEQLAALITDETCVFDKVKIVAQTGWTTTNLKNGIQNDSDLLESYSFVTLLIGVNNQYQNKPIDLYEKEFPELLNQAIGFAGGDKEKVFVVSIPDYAYTPFGGGRQTISDGIDLYNEINRRITEEAGITYFDITPISRRGLDEVGLVAEDNLHPSGEQYKLWAELMKDIVKSKVR